MVDVGTDVLYNKRFELVWREKLVSRAVQALPPYTVTYPDGSTVTFEVGDEVEVVRVTEEFANDGMGSSGPWRNWWCAREMKVGQKFVINNLSDIGVRGVCTLNFPLTALRNLTKQPKPKTIGDLLKGKIDVLLAQQAKLRELEGNYAAAMGAKVVADATVNSTFLALTTYRDSIQA